MPDLDPLKSVAVSGLVSASLIAALIPALVNTGVLSPRGAREIYENALLMIETQQGDNPAVGRIYEAARELIEAQARIEIPVLACFNP